MLPFWDVWAVSLGCDPKFDAVTMVPALDDIYGSAKSSKENDIISTRIIHHMLD